MVVTGCVLQMAAQIDTDPLCKAHLAVLIRATEARQLPCQAIDKES